MSATDEGRQAAIDGKHHLNNPYKVLTGNHDQWNGGYWEDELNEDNSDLEAADSKFSKLRGLDWEAISQAAEYLAHTGGGPLEERLRTLYEEVKELLWQT